MSLLESVIYDQRLRLGTPATASLTLDFPGVDNTLVFTAQTEGRAGNSISVEIVTHSGAGIPTLALEGTALTYTVSSAETLEISGTLSYNGGFIPPYAGNPGDGAFSPLWYAGMCNEHRSWSLDGESVTWPLTRDGDFALHDGSSWHLIRRQNGEVVMHWQADSDVDAFDLPAVAYDENHLDSWRGMIPACTGTPHSHLGNDARSPILLPFALSGYASIGFVGNAEAASLLTIAVADGQSGYGLVATTARQWLTGGIG